MAVCIGRLLILTRTGLRMLLGLTWNRFLELLVYLSLLVLLMIVPKTLLTCLLLVVLRCSIVCLVLTRKSLLLAVIYRSLLVCG